MKQEFIIKLRRLRRLLLVSGFFNILLAASFLLSFFPTPSFQELQQILPDPFSSSAIEISTLSAKLTDASFQELTTHLADGSRVKHGYKVRDIALSFLVSEHGLDLQRALNQKISLQKKYLGIEKGGQKKFIELFQLSEQQFSAVLHFCKEERWPFTTKKLFSELTSSKPHPPSLEYAFFLTQEFASIEKLLQKKYSQLAKSSILSILSEGPYSLVEKWSQLSHLESPSEDLFREFLFDYISLGSNKATVLYLQTDMEHALENLEEKKVQLLLAKKDKDPLKAKFAIALTAKNCGKLKLRYAKDYLLDHFEGDQTAIISKEDWYKRQVLSNSSASVSKAKMPPPCKALSPSVYTVQKGDTLWSISQKFSTSIGKIKTYNKLLSDLLMPGMQLAIPEKLHNH